MTKQFLKTGRWRTEMWGPAPGKGSATRGPNCEHS